jgi:DHA3 family macrolide efflux protein-like MFS transporter
MNDSWKKKILLFLSSQTISMFGSSIVQYAIMWHITLRTQSGFFMTVSIICSFMPMFFLSPFTGVWADRYDRKVLIMLSDSMIALMTLTLAILFSLGYDAVWLLFAASSVRSFGTAVQSPAVGAYIPQLVPNEKLTKINSLNSSVQSMVTFVSPMISGALLTVTSMEVIFMIDVLTAILAVLILLLFLKVPPHARALEKKTTGYFRDMRDGISYIKEHTFLKIYFIYLALFYILISPSAFLTPLQVTRSFGTEVWRLTAIEVAFSFGMVLGGIVMASWGGFKNRIYSMSLSCFAMGVCSIALGIVPNFFIYIFFMALFGIVMPLLNTPATVLLQQKVEGDYMGRIFSILGMISSVMMPAGMLIFGPAADYLRIEYLLVGTGILILIFTVFFATNKTLVKAGES